MRETCGKLKTKKLLAEKVDIITIINFFICNLEK